jgi:tRNA threonylcarbamoyladenosine biosynthesis protein TsaB
MAVRVGLLLAIESGGEHVGVALIAPAGVDGGEMRTLAEASVHAPRSQARLLMLEADRLFARAGVAPDALDTVAVAVGPGSYTGLRVGIATALGLTAAGGGRAVGVPSLEAVAFAGGRCGEACLVAAVDAGRGAVYAQAFAWPQGRRRPEARGDPARLEGPALMPFARRAARDAGAEAPLAVVVGAVAAAAFAGAGEGAAGAIRVDVLDRVPARAVGELALEAIAEEVHGHGQALAVAPIYLRPAATAAGA